MTNKHGDTALKSGDRARENRAWTSGRARRHQALQAAGVEVGHVVVQGQRLRYAQSPGAGEPLLFCNGIGANFELILPFVRALAGRRVILFDVPGTGGSQAAWFWPSFPAYARLAVGVLDQLGHGGSFVAAGVSWGGGLAQQIAHDYEPRVSRLILMATCAGFLMIPGRPSALVRMLTPQRYLSRNFMARNAATIYGGEMRGRPDLAIDLAELTRAPSTLTYLQQLTALSQFTSPRWLHRIRCPALVMNGDDDPLMRTVNARILAALLGNARLHLVRGGGHLFLSLQAEETARVVAEFLDEPPMSP
jgi:poly(3-hydroxyalkanoate) depolymerase